MVPYSAYHTLLGNMDLLRICNIFSKVGERNTKNEMQNYLFKKLIQLERAFLN